MHELGRMETKDFAGSEPANSLTAIGAAEGMSGIEQESDPSLQRKFGELFHIAGAAPEMHAEDG